MGFATSADTEPHEISDGDLPKALTGASEHPLPHRLSSGGLRSARSDMKAAELETLALSLHIGHLT